MLTETSPLNAPAEATLDELNCQRTDKGGRAPRLGYSNLTDVTAHPTISEFAKSQGENIFNFFVWDNPGEVSALKFVVIQNRNLLTFYDISEFNRVRPLPTIFDLRNYLIGSKTVINETCEMFQGKGALFVCSSEIESFYLEYNPITRVISRTEIDIKIRDFDQFSVELELDEEPQNPPDEFIYNLRNQGWVNPVADADDPIDQYIEEFNRYPSLAMQWWVSKRFDTDPPDIQRFSPAGMRAEFFGNAQAPQGHYIYSAFNLNRGERSGLDVQNTVKNFRCKAGCFALGRAFWTDGSLIYFSQQIESNLKKAEECYQAGDPTAEYINELVDTDGGVVSIIEANDIRKLQTIRDGVIVFAANGVWSIQGGEGEVFKPGSYRVYQVTNDGIINQHAVTLVNDSPVWASGHSINTLRQNEVSGRFEAQSLTEQTIKTFYIEEVENKQSIRIYYDRLDDKLYVMYSSSDTDNLTLDRALIFEGGWMPWRFDSQLENDGQAIIGAFVTDQIGLIQNDVNVTVGGAPVTVGGVVVTAKSNRVSTNVTTSITFINLNAADEVRFGRFQSFDFLDYGQFEYDYYLQTQNLIDITLSEEKNAKYLTCYFAENQGNDFCSIRGYWDFNISTVPEDTSPSEEVYKSLGIHKTVNRKRVQVPGSGEFLSLRFQGAPGKGFELFGFTIDWETERRK